MNVTLTLEESLVREARHEAVERGVSLSGLVAESLQRELNRKRVYLAARDHSVRVLEEGLDLGGAPLRRDEIYGERVEGSGES